MTYDEPGGPVLKDGGERGRQVSVAFREFQRIDEDLGEYLVRIGSTGLDAEVPVIAFRGGDGLAEFLEHLFEDFQGWQGERLWRSLEEQLQIAATWRSGGHVTLSFRARPSVYDLWTVTVDIALEAGEEMRLFSEEVRAFFTPHA